jgi:hypothetical protein
MSVIDRLGAMDRRIVFLFIALAVAIPLLLRMTLPEKTTPIVQNIFDKVESLPEGAKVLLSFDYGPSTEPEVHPMAFAVTRHLLERNAKLYIMCLWATGQDEAVAVIREVIEVEFPDKAYGVDYVNLGYKAGNEGVINVIISDLKKLYTTDAAGTPINDIPMMRGIRNLRNFNLIVTYASGKPGVKEWVQFGGDPGDIPVAAGTTAVDAPLQYPYYPRQLLGLMGGLKGAAEYEYALMEKYPEYEQRSHAALDKMGPQAVAHVVIMLFIIIGNVTFFVQKARKSA